MTTTTQTCQIEKCKHPYRAKGYCDRHYQQWRRGELAHPRYRTCNQENCRKKWFASGYCEEHYNTRFGKKGEAPAAKALAPEAKAVEKTEKKEAPDAKPPEPPQAA